MRWRFTFDCERGVQRNHRAGDRVGCGGLFQRVGETYRRGDERRRLYGKLPGADDEAGDRAAFRGRTPQLLRPAEQDQDVGAILH